MFCVLCCVLAVLAVRSSTRARALTSGSYLAVGQYVEMLPELQQIVREAGRIAQDARLTQTRSLKQDGSIVTNGDKLAEEYIRGQIERLLPRAGIWGEEFGRSDEGEDGLWLVDPIDGTSNYSFGSPLWGVSLGLIKGEELMLGAVELPDLRETYVAAKGAGVRRNDVPLKAIPEGPVKPEELVSYGQTVMKAGQPLPGKFRCSGAFVVDGTFVASQRYRALVGYREKLYDVAPCILFGQELNAAIQYADGEPFDIGELKDGRVIERPWMIFPKGSGFRLTWA